jgi:hypothetical protein
MGKRAQYPLIFAPFGTGHYTILIVSPVTLHPKPAAATVNPMAWDPSPVTMRIIDVVAGNPYVISSVPPPMRGVPKVIVAGWRRDRLDPGWRWSYVDNDFGSNGFGRQAHHAPGNHQPCDGAGEPDTFQQLAHILNKPR